MNKWLELLKSRKFWAAVVGLGFVILKTLLPDFPLDESQLTNLVWLLAAYILGVAVEEGLAGARARSR